MDNFVAASKAAFLAGVAVIFAAVPPGLTLAVVVLAAMANMLGLLAAWRNGERISGQKTLLGLIRILVYLVLIPLCWYIFGVIDFHVFAKAIVGVFAGYEIVLLIDKAHDLGVIPKSLARRLMRVLERFLGEVENQKGGHDAK